MRESGGKLKKKKKKERKEKKAETPDEFAVCLVHTHTYTVLGEITNDVRQRCRTMCRHLEVYPTIPIRRTRRMINCALRAPRAIGIAELSRILDNSARSS